MSYLRLQNNQNKYFKHLAFLSNFLFALCMCALQIGNLLRIESNCAVHTTYVNCTAFRCCGKLFVFWLRFLFLICVSFVVEHPIRPNSCDQVIAITQLNLQTLQIYILTEIRNAFLRVCLPLLFRNIRPGTVC